MSQLYASGGKVHCSDYTEIYIPSEYFDNNIAVNKGSAIETIGIVFIKTYKDGKAGKLQLLNIPTPIHLVVYEFRQDSIETENGTLDVLVLEYLKDAYVFHQTIPKGRDVANAFLEMMLAGKVPRNLHYLKVIDVWWQNILISGISYKVPSKLYEMIIAAIYRNKNNMKQRYGQYYGKQANPSGYDYKTGNVRTVVKDLSTFSGMVYEDIGSMISNGINNSIDGVEEPVSPLEKIIYY